MNAFDGTLTIIGVLTGSYVARVESASVVISTGLATSVAMGISGLWGAYFTEAAERKRDLDELENHTLTDLSETRIGRASRVAGFTVAVVDGLAPFLSALVALLPFFFSVSLGDIYISYYLSLGIALLSLFGLGAFLGMVSRGNFVLWGLKMIGAGLLSIVLGYLLGGLEGG
jgi:predicted membrane protein (TIGR00267 family)